MNELALFAGAGGGILGGKLLGWRTVCAVERDAYAAQVLAQRQNDGLLEAFPIWSDVCSFDGKPWRGIVDVVSGGFPCQDISAGGKGAGITGERSGLWSEFARIIGEIMTQYVFVENSPMLTVRGLGTVLRDLAKMGFNAEWGVLSARDLGGCHLRERCWILATNTNMLRQLHTESEINTAKVRFNAQRDFTSSIEIDVTDDGRERIQGQRQKPLYQFKSFPWGEDVRSLEDLRNRSDLPKPLLWGSNDGVANRVERTKAVGNGQVPRVAATAFTLLKTRIQSNHSTNSST